MVECYIYQHQPDPSWDPNHARIQRHLRGQALHSSKVAEAVKHLTLQILQRGRKTFRWENWWRSDFHLIYLPWKSWNNQKDHERSWKIKCTHQLHTAAVTSKPKLQVEAFIKRLIALIIAQAMSSHYQCAYKCQPTWLIVVWGTLHTVQCPAGRAAKSKSLSYLIVSYRTWVFGCFFVSTLRHDSPRYRDSASIASTQNP